jgi:uncharacterized membrane protein HdeD (DUF308 family)
MTFLSVILKSLKTPDDQKLDWYGWATNQTGHFTIGVIITAIAIQVLPVHFAILPALVFAGIKESIDMFRNSSFKDSLIDWIFQGVGAIFSIVFFIKNMDLLNLTISSFLVFLVFGVIPRVRRAFRKQ